LKPILPSLREKNRYVVFKVNSNEKLGFGEVKKGVENGCFKLMGQLNMARAGLRVMDEWENNKGVIKVSNKYLDEVHAGLLFIQGINGKKAGVESVYVSGVLNKAKERLRERDSPFSNLKKELK